MANAPVGLSGTGVAATYTATVTPSPRNFGNWPASTNSTMNLTVTNTGNSPLTNGLFTLGAGSTSFTRLTTGSFPSGAPNCGTTLAVATSCTIKVQFAAPATAGNYTRSLAITYANAAVVTGAPVTINGTSTSTKATVSITPNPLAITAPGILLPGNGTVTFTNSSAAGTGTGVTVTGVAVNGGGLLSGWSFSKGTDNCTGVSLAPQASCTVQVNFSTLTPGTSRSGTIVFTDSGTGSPQTGNLTGK